MCLRLLVKWVSSLFLLTDDSKPLGVDATNMLSNFFVDGFLSFFLFEAILVNAAEKSWNKSFGKR